MKKTTYFKKWIGLILGLCVCLAGCKEDKFMELDEFYRFKMVKELKLDTLAKKVFIMGFENTDSKLNAKAFDAISKELAIPSNAIKYFANGEELEEGHFAPAEEGDYQIYARLGNIISDTIFVRIWNKDAMKIVLTPQVPAGFVADGLSQAVFKPEVYLNEVLTAGGPVPDIYIDGQKATSTFSTRKAGLFEIQAKGLGLESNKIILEVLSPVKKLTLTQSMTSDVFLANNTSEITLTALGFDAANQPMALSEDIKIYYNGVLQDSPFRFKTSEPGTHTFVAKGYKLESNVLSVVAQTPNIYNIVRLPVIFHEVNTKTITSSFIKETLANLTLAYRNNLNRSGGPRDANAADVFVEFYAATYDPSGKLLAVPGLDQITSAKSSFTINDIDDDAWSSFWSPETYINVWVFPNIKGDYEFSSWAYFPGVTQSLIGLNRAQKGSRPPYPYGVFWNAKHKTYVEVLAHEVGHVLGLEHVFDGNGSTFESCSTNDPDYCDDTPFYDRSAYEKSLTNGSNKNFYRRTSCSGDIFNSTNLMDYDYSYENSFTTNQVTRMRHVVNYGLWLPTPFNMPANGRLSTAPGKVNKPTGYIFTPPVICPIR